jgi:hypothetical protein
MKRRDLIKYLSVAQYVPVLTTKSGGQLRGILFGYSCLTTADMKEPAEWVNTGIVRHKVNQ